MTTSPGCAQGPDGCLLDASKITWYNDPDDSEPLPTTSRTMHASPVTKIAGSRRSGRSLQPSARIRDPENAATPLLLKCKPDNDAGTRRAKHPAVLISSDDNASENLHCEGDAGGATTEATTHQEKVKILKLT
jgi:hypothetical protein